VVDVAFNIPNIPVGAFKIVPVIRLVVAEELVKKLVPVPLVPGIIHGCPVDVAKHVAMIPPVKVDVAIPVTERDEMEVVAKVEVPTTEKIELGVDVPIPTLPFARIVKSEEVAKPADVVEATEKRGNVPPKACWTERTAEAVVVPIPTLPA
jgi:hypothetical protein